MQYIEEVLQTVKESNPNEQEFYQAVEEVLTSISQVACVRQSDVSACWYVRERITDYTGCMERDSNSNRTIKECAPSFGVG